jgi:hypothetical protein
LSFKKSLLKKNFGTSSVMEPNERKVVLKMELTAEDVDDLGDFAADIAEQPLEDIEALEGEVSD